MSDARFHNPDLIGPRGQRLLAGLPLATELYWWNCRQRYQGYYFLHAVETHAADMLAALAAHPVHSSGGRKIHLFGSWHYWIDFCAVLGLALAARGHRISLAYLPYKKFYSPSTPFELRIHDRYTQDRLSRLRPWLKPVSLRHLKAGDLPPELEQAARQVALYDTQYTLQTEETDPRSDLYQLRYERNRQAARLALTWLEADRPDGLIIPNGSIQEYSMVYRVARWLGIPVNTFEFSENQGEIWIAQNDDVMRQNTDSLWQARGAQPLSAEQWQKIRDLESARMGARTFGNSDRLWQDVPTAGGERVRRLLGLDERPVLLMATNVLGDSLTLGRNLFAESMAEWITRTIRFLADRPEVQLVVRIHPGERFNTGPSMAEVAQTALDHFPEHIHLVGPMEKVNTYDIMELTRLGLVYTTTTGLEMAMNGTPVIVAGQTHYRRRGFTLDPQTWEEYFALLEQHLTGRALQRLTAEQVELAWRYAYLFFFVYPLPFPWKLTTFRSDLETWPLSRLLGPEGEARFGRVFDYLAGEPIDWTLH